MPLDLEKSLIHLIESDPWRMAVLEAARSLELPDWCIAGGFVRAKVWDHLHGFTKDTEPSDIDLLYFDPAHLEPENEERFRARLASQMLLEWEPVNQARMHTYNEDPPYTSTAHALSHWAETANAVGVWLDADDRVKVVAPIGLDDLFGLTLRPNLKSPTARQVFLERIGKKNWKQRWPKLKVEMP